MKSFHYLRHGLSEANKLGVFAGSLETPLAPEGIEQAKLAGQSAKGKPIDIIFSSPQSRAHHTAKLFAREVGYPEDKIIIIPELREREFGVLEGKPHIPDRAKVIAMDPEGMEHDEQLIARAKDAFEIIQNHAYDHIVVVAHGSVGRALRAHVAPEADFEEKIDNATLLRWL